jgi:hypothetical protein
METRARHAGLPLLLIIALVGCGGGDKIVGDPWPVPPGDLPQADSPVHLVQRLEGSWKFQDLPEYRKLLAEDFRFRFSPLSDPMLVDRYPNWGVDDEVESARHLFEGFTNSSGELVPAAIQIELTLVGIAFEDDSTHADSTAHYRKVVVASMVGTIEFPGQSEPLIYSLSSRQEFLLVRGDAAVLAQGVAADSTRWYLRRWDDLSANPFVSRRKTIDAVTAKTYGAIKAQYRN